MSFSSCSIILLLLCSSSIVDNYVFNTDHDILLVPGDQQQSSKKSMFGYSLDFVAGTNNRMPWLMVGAPKANQGGSLNACNVDASMNRLECADRTPNLQSATDQESFSDQLFGVSVAAGKSSLNGNEVWSCAPRFERAKEKLWANSIKHTYQLMLGQCFIYSSRDNFVASQRVVPLGNHEPIFYGRDGYRGQGYIYGTVYAETGQSLHYDRQDDRVLLGSPGAWNWTGTMVVTDWNGNNPVMTQPWSEIEPRLNDYAGYDITSGHFLKRSSRPRQYVIGAPRAGKNREGTVFVVDYHDNSIEQVSKIHGRQTGEYFGAAVTSVDLNGDGIDEIVIGAPLFTHEEKKGYEEGRVSIQVLVSSSTQVRFKEEESIFGRAIPGSRFGSSLVNLRDIDGDGYEDFAVGSPYEDNGHGAVSVYYGNPQIVKIQNPQIIKATKLNSNLRGFGISFSVNHQDVDNNGLEDLAIGSHISGHAVILRRTPSVWIDLKLTSTVSSIDVGDIKDFSLGLCLTLRSHHHQLTSTTFQSTVTVTADPRTDFVDVTSLRVDQKSLNLTLTLGGERCTTVAIVTMRQGFNPTLEEPPLRFQATVAEQKRLTHPLPMFNGQAGVLDPRKQKIFDMQIPFQSSCSLSCLVDLTLEAGVHPDLSVPFLIGSAKFLTLVFTVVNLGKDPAFQPLLKIPYSDQLGIRRVAKECSTSRTENLVNCELPGPIKPKKSFSIEVDFDVSQIKGGQQSISWNGIEVYSRAGETTQDTNLANNLVSFSLALRTEADIEITAPVVGKRFSYKDAYGELTDREFVQNFQVRRYLSSPISGITAKVDIPTHYKDKEFMTHVSTELITNGGELKVECSTNENMERVGIGRASALIPTRINCNSPGVRCLELFCPQFNLDADKEITADVRVKLRFMPSQIVDILQEDGNFITLMVASEGHVSLPPDLKDMLEPFNNKPDNVLYSTEFVEKIEDTSISAQTIIWIVLGTLCVVVLCVFCLCCFTNFFNAKKPQEGLEVNEEDFQEPKPESESLLDEENPDKDHNV